MKINKKYMILLGIFTIYILVMFLIFGRDFIRNNLDSSTIAISPDTIWNFEQGKWKDNGNKTDYSMKNYEVYEDSKYLGELKLTYNDKLYLFDSERKPVRYENSIIAVKGSIDIGVIPFKNTTISNSNKVVTKILKEKKIKVSRDTLTSKLIKIDLDNDGKLEEIYTISNVFNTDDYSNSIAIIAVLENNEITYLKEDVKEGKYTLTMCMPYIQNIIDIDKDKKYEIITTCSYYSNNGTCHTLFDNDYKMLKGC